MLLTDRWIRKHLFLAEVKIQGFLFFWCSNVTRQRSLFLLAAQNAAQVKNILQKVTKINYLLT